MLLSTALNALFCKYVNTAIEDHELSIVVVNPATNYNIVVMVECF